jgi:hypothetical protein
MSSSSAPTTTTEWRYEMNTMNMPGCTGENAIYKTVTRFQSEAARNFGGEKKDNQVYMQKPNNKNTAGGACHATSGSGSASVNVGTYNNEGYCCGPKLSNGSQLCINCDNGTCNDGVQPFTLPYRVFQSLQEGRRLLLL